MMTRLIKDGIDGKLQPNLWTEYDQVTLLLILTMTFSERDVVSLCIRFSQEIKSNKIDKNL